MLVNWWHWNFALEDATETLSTMPENLLAWVDFLILGAWLLLIDSGDKLPASLVLVILFAHGLVTCGDLVRQKKGVLDLLILIFLSWIEQCGWNLTKDKSLL